MRKPFLAIDGEAVKDDYVLLADSSGRTLTTLERGGISSKDAFRFLLEAPPDTVKVCFGLGYDVNNWLRDLPRSALERLWKEHVAYWFAYRIEWVPGRWFALTCEDGRRVRINEVFGFFQSSFVKALEAWGIGAPAEIERMKRQRGSFRRQDIERVSAYCLSECDLLVELMDQLRAATVEVGMVPRQWIGAGSIAAALLNARGVAPHHAYDLDIASEQVATEAILGAYYAGRIELCHQGVHKAVRTADIRSAYPAAATKLPSLAGVQLVHRRRFEPSCHGVWRVSWNLGAGSHYLAPFPARHKQRIYWPVAGTGWYHSVEVAAAIECGFPVAVAEGWVLRERKAERPFQWIEALYRERARLKSEGRAAEKVMKLGLNSIYGKLAQGYGFHARPHWQSYFWAGYITAATRARMLRAASAARDVLMIATDGLFCRATSLRDSAKLGGWELGGLDRLFCAQAGVYQGITPQSTIVKSRGFFAAEVDYDQLREGYELEGAAYVHHYDSTRFMGLGVSLMRKDFSVWRSWRTERRALLLAPERKGVSANGRLTAHSQPIDSEPYQPKLSLIEGRALDQLQGLDQPMKETI